MKTISRSSPLVIGLFAASVLPAQGILERDSVPLKNWDAPLYWQPNAVESKDAAARQLLAGNVGVDRANSITPAAQTPANSLVFVGMTPCRIADTRDQSYPAGFGPPSLVGGVARTFAIQSNPRCFLPSIAQAYSFNITVVPQGVVVGQLNPNGALRYLSIWPTGIAQPVVSTLNSYLGTVVANAAIVPAGTNGAVDVFALDNTDLIIDINGYYAAQSGITLAQGAAAAPSLSFSGDPGTGIFSSGTGVLNVATGGANRLSVSSNGNVGMGTTAPEVNVHVKGPESRLRLETTENNAYSVTEYKTSSANWHTGVGGPGVPSGVAGKYFVANLNTAQFPMVVDTNGNVGIGTTTPSLGKLHVEGGSGAGVFGHSDNWRGVFGNSFSGSGVHGLSFTGYGVFGFSSNNYAGYFDGSIRVTSAVVQGSDERLKQRVANLRYGLHELMQLRPVNYTWKEKPEEGVQLGLIAQEVETVLPELVSTDKDAEQTKGLNYIGLVPVTIKAIQEQQAQIESQQERISEQQEQLEEQRRQIDGLKLLVCPDHPQAAVCK